MVINSKKANYTTYEKLFCAILKGYFRTSTVFCRVREQRLTNHRERDIMKEIRGNQLTEEDIGFLLFLREDEDLVYE